MKVIKPNILPSTDGSITRSTAATYFDKDLLLKSAAINEVRFNYNYTTGDFEGVMIENASTNLLTYSEDLWDTTKWSVGSTLANFFTVTSEGTLPSPKGTTGNVAKFVFNSTAGLFLRKSGLSLPVGDYSASIFIYIPVQVGVNSVLIQCDFNDVDATTNISVSKFGKWVRVLVPKKTINTARQQLDYNIFVNGVNPPVGFTFYAFGAQLESGNHTSYITSGASATLRAAEVVTGAGLMYSSATDSNPIWNSATTYVQNALVRYNNKIWSSLQSSNTNHPPTSSPTWWIEIGPDNMHAAFDNQISTVTTATTTLTFVVRPGNIDSIALINMQAVTAQLVMYDPTAGIVSSKIAGLSGAEVYDWYQYFFYDPLLIRTQVIFSDLPLYSNALITIRLQGQTGDIVSLALAAFGIVENLGGTQYGATAGIVDYSIKETDDFGTVTFVKRNFSKRLSSQLFLDNSSLNRVTRFLYNLRATPAVWIGSDDPTLEEPTVVYGFYKEFSIELAYPKSSLCSLEIEGLT